MAGHKLLGVQPSGPSGLCLALTMFKSTLNYWSTLRDPSNFTGTFWARGSAVGAVSQSLVTAAPWGRRLCISVGCIHMALACFFHTEAKGQFHAI